MIKTAWVICAGLFVAAGSWATVVGAQATRSANEGIYTDEQATRGEAVYIELCAACHGDNLEGSGPMPALAGPDFQTVWSMRTVGELFEKTQNTMPATAPGTLTPDQVADVVAYMLRAGTYPSGTTPLATDIAALGQYMLDAPGGAAAPASAGAPSAAPGSASTPAASTPPASPAPASPVPAAPAPSTEP